MDGVFYFKYFTKALEVLLNKKKNIFFAKFVNVNYISDFFLLTWHFVNPSFNKTLFTYEMLHYKTGKLEKLKQEK